MTSRAAGSFRRGSSKGGGPRVRMSISEGPSRRRSNAAEERKLSFGGFIRSRSSSKGTVQYCLPGTREANSGDLQVRERRARKTSRWQAHPKREAMATLAAAHAEWSAAQSPSAKLETDNPDTLELVDDDDESLVNDKDDEVLRVLEKNEDDRTEEEVDLVKAATSDVKFFEKLTPEQHRELCRTMTCARRESSPQSPGPARPACRSGDDAYASRRRYEHVEKAEDIFRQGDEGTTFYIIFRGAAKCYVSASKDVLGTCVCVLEDGDSYGGLASRKLPNIIVASS